MNKIKKLTDLILMYLAFLMIFLGVIFLIWDIQRLDFVEVFFDILFIFVNLVTALYLRQHRRSIDRSLIEVDRTRETIIVNLNVHSSIDKPKTIGDISCKYNARSPYLQCTINPQGNCQKCLHYLQ